MKWKERYIQERTRYDTGFSQFYQARNLIMIYVLIDLWLSQKLNYSLPSGVAIAVGAVAILCFWLLGYIWDKYKMYHIMNEFQNKRNPTIQTIKEKVLYTSGASRIYGKRSSNNRTSRKQQR